MAQAFPEVADQLNRMNRNKSGRSRLEEEYPELQQVRRHTVEIRYSCITPWAEAKIIILGFVYFDSEVVELFGIKSFIIAAQLFVLRDLNKILFFRQSWKSRETAAQNKRLI